MSGIWVLPDRKISLNDDGGSSSEKQSDAKKKELVHLPTGEVISSYQSLERILTELGWERYYDNPELFQFHKRTSIDLISLPKNFSKLTSIHMYDIVIKNPKVFLVRDVE